MRKSVGTPSMYMLWLLCICFKNHALSCMINILKSIWEILNMYWWLWLNIIWNLLLRKFSFGSWRKICIFNSNFENFESHFATDTFKIHQKSWPYLVSHDWFDLDKILRKGILVLLVRNSFFFVRIWNLFHMACNLWFHYTRE